jgi:hypothetical protein
MLTADGPSTRHFLNADRVFVFVWGRSVFFLDYDNKECVCSADVAPCSDLLNQMTSLAAFPVSVLLSVSVSIQ